MSLREAGSWATLCMETQGISLKKRGGEKYHRQLTRLKELNYITEREVGRAAL